MHQNNMEYLFKVIFNFRNHQPVKLHIVAVDSAGALVKGLNKIDGRIVGEERPSHITMEELALIDIK